MMQKLVYAAMVILPGLFWFLAYDDGYHDGVKSAVDRECPGHAIGDMQILTQGLCLHLQGDVKIRPPAFPQGTCGWIALKQDQGYYQWKLSGDAWLTTDGRGLFDHRPNFGDADIVSYCVVESGKIFAVISENQRP